LVGKLAVDWGARRLQEDGAGCDVVDILETSWVADRDPLRTLRRTIAGDPTSYEFFCDGSPRSLPGAAVVRMVVPPLPDTGSNFQYECVISPLEAAWNHTISPALPTRWESTVECQLPPRVVSLSVAVRVALEVPPHPTEEPGPVVLPEAFVMEPLPGSEIPTPPPPVEEFEIPAPVILTSAGMIGIFLIACCVVVVRTPRQFIMGTPGLQRIGSKVFGSKFGSTQDMSAIEDAELVEQSVTKQQSKQWWQSETSSAGSGRRKKRSKSPSSRAKQAEKSTESTDSQERKVSFLGDAAPADKEFLRASAWTSPDPAHEVSAGTPCMTHSPKPFASKRSKSGASGRSKTPNGEGDSGTASTDDKGSTGSDLSLPRAPQPGALPKAPAGDAGDGVSPAGKKRKKSKKKKRSAKREKAATAPSGDEAPPHDDEFDFLFVAMDDDRANVPRPTVVVEEDLTSESDSYDSDSDESDSDSDSSNTSDSSSSETSGSLEEDAQEFAQPEAVDHVLTAPASSQLQEAISYAEENGEVEI